MKNCFQPLRVDKNGLFGNFINVYKYNKYLDISRCMNSRKADIDFFYLNNFDSNMIFFFNFFLLFLPCQIPVSLGSDSQLYCSWLGLELCGFSVSNVVCTCHNVQCILGSVQCNTPLVYAALIWSAVHRRLPPSILCYLLCRVQQKQLGELSYICCNSVLH